MATPPLSSLQAFLAVARRLRFAAAARDLGVSASALTQSIQRLEAQLDVALFTRTSRSVALTEAGRRLLETAGPAVDQAILALETVKSHAGEIAGRVRLTVPAAAVSLVLDRLVPRFAERYPKVELDVRVEDRFVDTVAEGFDAGVRLIEAIDRDMVHVRLTPPARLVVAGSPAYLERRGTPQKPEDLLRHDCIGMRWAEAGEPWAWELERGKRTWRVPVRGPVTTNDGALMRALALAGVGLVYAIEPLIAADVAAGRLRVVLEAYAPHVPGLFLYYPSRAQVSPALRALIEVAREVVRDAAAPARARARPRPIVKPG